MVQYGTLRVRFVTVKPPLQSGIVRYDTVLREREERTIRYGSIRHGEREEIEEVDCIFESRFHFKLRPNLAIAHIRAKSDVIFKRTGCSPSPPRRRPVAAPSPPRRRPVAAPSPPRRRPVAAPSPPRRRPVAAPSPPRRRPVAAPSPPRRRPVAAPSPPRRRPVAAPSPPRRRSVAAPGLATRQEPVKKVKEIYGVV
ncbi:uncharacterized protein [Procambarus clarkii]|uniref:uncharacterized protein n=1 Tax=Procambarus clarkii TaxID=6728 RepID=UPI0037434F18